MNEKWWNVRNHILDHSSAAGHEAADVRVGSYAASYALLGPTARMEGVSQDHTPFVEMRTASLNRQCWYIDVLGGARTRVFASHAQHLALSCFLRTHFHAATTKLTERVRLTEHHLTAPGAPSRDYVWRVRLGRWGLAKTVWRKRLQREACRPAPGRLGGNGARRWKSQGGPVFLTEIERLWTMNLLKKALWSKGKCMNS
ncbi:hypothetical protein Tco_1077475 [Tanacetum coccineum]